MTRLPIREMSPRRRLTLPVMVLLGIWIAAAPFARPLPGGASFSFESTPELAWSTPEVACRTPLVGAFSVDTPSADVYISPKPVAGDPMMSITVECGGRARFRLVLGSTLVVVAVGLVVLDRRRGG